MQLKVHEMPIYGVLRRGVEVELKWVVLFLNIAAHCGIRVSEA